MPLSRPSLRACWSTFRARLVFTILAVRLRLARTPSLAQAQISPRQRPKASGTQDTTKQTDVRSKGPKVGGTTTGGTIVPVTGLPPVITPPACTLTGAPNTILATDAACSPCSAILAGGPPTLWRNSPACTPCARPGMGSLWSGNPSCAPLALVANLSVFNGVGLSIGADPRGSYNPVGTFPIEMWSYNWGDGGPVVNAGTPAVMGHTYGAPGTYTVTLTVTNTKGDLPGSMSASIVVTVGSCTMPADQTRSVACGAGFVSGSRTEMRGGNAGDPGPGFCSYANWTEVSNTCVAGTSCTAGATETRVVACGAGYVSGNRTERRDPDTGAAGPGACPFSAWYETGNTCVAATPCTTGGSETRTVGCGPGYVSGSRTEQRDPDTGSAGPGACALSAWYEIANTCVATRACTPGAPQTRTVGCGAGFRGTITEQRDPNTAAAGPGACPFAAWLEISNSCVATGTPCSMPSDETRTVACGAGYQAGGTRTETRTGNSGDTGPGTCSFGAWTETSNSCVAINACVPGASETRTVACASGASGSITETRNPDVNAAGPGACAFGPWTETSNTCACAGPLFETRDLACTSGTGQGTPQQRDKAAYPSCGWGAWYDTGPSDCTNAPLCTLTGAPSGMLASNRECAACPTIPGTWYAAPACSGPPKPRAVVAVVVGSGETLDGYASGGCSGSGTTWSCSVSVLYGMMCGVNTVTGEYYTCGVMASAGGAQAMYCSEGVDGACPGIGPSTVMGGPMESTEDLVLMGSTFCIDGGSGAFGRLSTLENAGLAFQSKCLLTLEWVYK